MRETRLFIQSEESVHWCTSKLQPHLPGLSDDEMLLLKDLMFRYSYYSGFSIYTCAIIPRALHILIYLPKPKRLDDKELIERAEYVFQDIYVNKLSNKLNNHNPHSKLGSNLRKSIFKQMYNLSNFHQFLKQDFSHKYNKAHNKSTNIWYGRFTNRPVELSDSVVSEVAAKIDAIPYIEGLTTSHEKYPFCGFGEAAKGNPEQREHIKRFLNESSWQKACSRYSKMVQEQTELPRRINYPRVYGNIKIETFRKKVQKQLKKNRPKSHDDIYNDNIEALKAFKKRFGHCNVPILWPENPELGTWLKNQRNYKKKGKLPQRKLQQLNDLGVEWFLRRGRYIESSERGVKENTLEGQKSKVNRFRWELHFAELAAYKNKNGHIDVSRNDKSNKTLFNWIWRQRQMHQKEMLSSEMIEKLDSLGFLWSLRRGR